MSKSPLISEKALERQHTIRGVCKREPVTAKDYAEYQQDKKEGIMNTLIKIAPNFKKLMDSYILSKAFNTHENCIKHVIKPFVKNELCPGDVPENREIITKHIGRLIEGLEKANKAEEERIALSLESYLIQLVSTKYGTFTGGRKRRRTRRRKKRRKKTKKRRRKRKKRGATKKRKHPEGSQDEPSSSRPRSRRMRIREIWGYNDDEGEWSRERNIADSHSSFRRPTESERLRLEHDLRWSQRTMATEHHHARFFEKHGRLRDRWWALRRRRREGRQRRAVMPTEEELQIFIQDTIKLRNEMMEFIRKYDFETPMSTHSFRRVRNLGRMLLDHLRDHISAHNRWIVGAEDMIMAMEDDEED